MSRPMPAVFGTRPAATRMWLPSMVCSPELVRRASADLVAGLALTLRSSAPTWIVNAFVAQDPTDFLRDVGILAAHQLRPGFDDGHFGAEAAIGLRQFEAGIAAADHDQMRRQDVELERFDMGQRFRRLEARNIGNGGMRSHVQEHLVADQRARSSVIQAHFDRLRRDEAPRPHDQFGAAFLVVLQMRVDEPLRPCRAYAGEPSPCRP